MAHSLGMYDHHEFNLDDAPTPGLGIGAICCIAIFIGLFLPFSAALITIGAALAVMALNTLLAFTHVSRQLSGPQMELHNTYRKAPKEIRDQIPINTNIIKHIGNVECNDIVYEIKQACRTRENRLRVESEDYQLSREIHNLAVNVKRAESKAYDEAVNKR